nr:MAG TPA: hypothetical protein [Caudoviricetes sp.]
MKRQKGSRPFETPESGSGRKNRKRSGGHTYIFGGTSCEQL